MKSTVAARPSVRKTKAEAQAAAPAPKRRASAGTAGRRPRKRIREDKIVSDGDLISHGDLISKLPDDILGTIISLLPKTVHAPRPSLADGALSGAQRLSTWTPPTTSAPTSSSASPSSPGSSPTTLAPPAASSFASSASTKRKKRYAEEAAQIENCFHTRALTNLKELDISFELLHYEHEKLYPLPPSVFCLAPTLLVVEISSCKFPNGIAHSLSFSLLKQLTLWRVSISEDVFREVLSACDLLESLKLMQLRDANCLRISSTTLRSVSLCACFAGNGELFIEDAPLLERLLLPCPGQGGETIRVIKAPKLEILGLLSPCISEIEIANVVFQSLTATSLNNTIATVKVLALEFLVPDLNAVIDVLRCFPCLEKLHVIWEKYLKIGKKKAPQYDPLDPVKCLETYLKKLVLINFEGSEQDVGFAKFFVLNAKVLKEIKFGVSHRINKEWVSDQYRLLEMGNRASRGAQLEFIQNDHVGFLDAHDLSNADPFNSYFTNEDDDLSE